MLTKSDAQAARLLKSRLRKITPVCRLVVYGSRARGQANPDSDLDIFLELPDLTPEIRRRIREAAWAVSLEKGMVISTFVASTEAIQNSPLAADPILKSINREGIPV